MDWFNDRMIASLSHWCTGGVLTHWGRVTHICVSKLTIIGSDNGLSPNRRQAIIWTNAGLLLIASLGTNFSEILIEILTFSFKKMRLKVSSAKRRPFCLGLNMLRKLYKIAHCQATVKYRKTRPVFKILPICYTYMPICPWIASKNIGSFYTRQCLLITVKIHIVINSICYSNMHADSISISHHW